MRASSRSVTASVPQGHVELDDLLRGERFLRAEQAVDASQPTTAPAAHAAGGTRAQQHARARLSLRLSSARV